MATGFSDQGSQSEGTRCHDGALRFWVRENSSTFARDTKDERKAGIGDHRKTNSSTNVFDVTRDLVIRHHTYIDLIQGFVVMKSGIPVAGEATAHDRAEDVGVAC